MVAYPVSERRRVRPSLNRPLVHGLVDVVRRHSRPHHRPRLLENLRPEPPGRPHPLDPLAAGRCIRVRRRGLECGVKGRVVEPCEGVDGTRSGVGGGDGCAPSRRGLGTRL